MKMQGGIKLGYQKLIEFEERCCSTTGSSVRVASVSFHNPLVVLYV